MADLSKLKAPCQRQHEAAVVACANPGNTSARVKQASIAATRQVAQEAGIQCGTGDDGELANLSEALRTQQELCVGPAFAASDARHVLSVLASSSISSETRWSITGLQELPERNEALPATVLVPGAGAGRFAPVEPTQVLRRFLKA